MNQPPALLQDLYNLLILNQAVAEAVAEAVAVAVAEAVQVVRSQVEAV